MSKWACPGCGAKPGKHGKGECRRIRGSAFSETCTGFVCECDDDSDDKNHGTLASPCCNAHCYHCAFDGTFPKPPKGLQAWEKKALEAGWVMPAKRKKELKL